MEFKELGLKEVCRIDEDGLGYEWNIMSVLQHEDGRLFWYVGSGCSCNCEYEGCNTVEDFRPLNDSTFNEFEKQVKDFPSNGPDKIQMLGTARMLLPK